MTVSEQTFNNDFELVRDKLESLLSLTIRKPGKHLPYPFTTPSAGNFYSGLLWLWDNHHTSMRLAYQGNPEFLRHQVDNLLCHQQSDGYIPNRIHSENGPLGDTPRFHSQPLLFQAVAMYLDKVKDFDWGEQVYSGLCKYISFYEQQRSGPLGLFRWKVGFMGGFDNDVLHNFRPETVITADVNAWMYLEYRAAALMATTLGKDEDASTFTGKAEALKKAVNGVLWSKKHGSYCAWNLCSASHVLEYSEESLPDGVGQYTYQSFSNAFPLYAGMASPEQAKQMIETYLLSEKHFRCRYGIRSLSAASEFYNNAVWGGPSLHYYHERMDNSNWQGPVWSILVYIAAHAMENYGYHQEAIELSKDFIKTMANGIWEYGTTSENYHAETGKPLYARDFVSWNSLTDVLYEELQSGEWIMKCIVDSQ